MTKEAEQEARIVVLERMARVHLEAVMVQKELLAKIIWALEKIVPMLEKEKT